LDKGNILDMDVIDLKKIMEKLGQPSYRAKQVFKWLHKGIRCFDEMKNIPQKLREVLPKDFYIGMPEIIKKQVSRIDGTTKYLLKLFDDSLIECVILKYSYGNTLCISSQVGCRMGCSFCASTKEGLIRNLTPGEMVGQILVSQLDTGEKISNIVIMGSGEPLDNYENVIKFLKIVNNVDGLNIGLRHITLSTCGLTEGIDRLSKEGMPVTLSVSLHAADDETRKKLMTVAKRYKIKEIIEACKRYVSITGRRVTFEYALIKGINDDVEDAIRLVHLLKRIICHVNLIPVNPTQGFEYKQPEISKIYLFKDVLEQRGISVTIRREMGRDISGACGQLKTGYLKIRG